MISRILLFIWDFLVWALVAFPLVTGGIWIYRPGLKIELSELAVPVLIVTLLGLAIRKIAPLQNASSVRVSGVLAKKWRERLDRAPLKTLVSASILMALLFFIASLRRHWAFASNAYDLGIFTNGIWNLTHGNGYYSSVRGGMYLLTDHQSFIVWLLLPVLQIFQPPTGLLFLQALGLSLGGVSIYFLAKQYLGRDHWAVAALPWLYWAYSPMRNANAFDFHPETLILPLFLGAIAGLQSKKYRWLGFLLLALGLSAKETAPAVLAGISLAWVLGAGPEATRAFTKKLGFVLAPVGVGLFFFDLKWIPHLYGATHFHLQAHLGQYGGGFGSMLLAPILKPTVFWPNLLGPARLKFLGGTLAPLAFIPVLGWPAWVAALPGYLMLFLTEGDYKVSLQYHYAIEPAVGLFWGFVVGFARGPDWKRWKSPMVVLFFALAFFGRSELYRIRRFESNAHDLWLRSELLPRVHPTVSLAASTGLIPHLSNRAWAREVGVYEKPDGQPVQCVILDAAVNNWSIGTVNEQDFVNEMRRKGFQSVFECGSVYVYQHEHAGEACLTHLPTCGESPSPPAPPTPPAPSL